MRVRALVEQLLGGRPYPASRDELVEWARDEGAPEEVVAALRSLSAGDYRTANDVGEALFPTEPSSDGPPPEPRSRSGEPPGREAYIGG